MNQSDKTGTVEAVARAMGTSPVWLANLLGRMKVPVDPTTGRFASSDVERAFEEAAQALSQGDSAGLLTDEERGRLVAIAQMGQSADSVRAWAKEVFRASGFEIYSQGGREYSELTLARETEDGRELLKVQVHVGLSTKPASGQIGFVANVGNKEVTWHAFAARPFGRLYLRSRKEIAASMRSKVKDGNAYVTFSAGSTRNVFEDRLSDLVRDLNWRRG